MYHEPKVDQNRPFAMLVTLLSSDSYLGRCLVGRVIHGSAKINDTVKAINLKGEQVDTGRLTKLFTFAGTERIIAEKVTAG
jgi:GTP-binding protein